MTTQVQEMLHSFELLSEGDKRELATEILRRSLMLDSPPLFDEQLVGAAEEIFLQLDRREAGDGRSALGQSLGRGPEQAVCSWLGL